MATEIRVPTLGESVSEATVGKWFKKVGDTITADEPVVELETDKVTIEVPAPAAGRLAEIAVKDGETVGVGALLGQISGDGADVSPAPKKAAAPQTKPQAVAQAAGASGADSVKEAAGKTASVAGGGDSVQERKMPPAPAAAKLLAEHNLAVEQVAGSGKRGQVLKIQHPNGSIEQRAYWPRGWLKTVKLTPKGIIDDLDLRRPIYKKTAAFGHFGRTEPEFTWERTDKANALRADGGK